MKNSALNCQNELTTDNALREATQLVNKNNHGKIQGTGREPDEVTQQKLGITPWALGCEGYGSCRAAVIQAQRKSALEAERIRQHSAGECRPGSTSMRRLAQAIAAAHGLSHGRLRPASLGGKRRASSRASRRCRRWMSAIRATAG
ncbi:hypothetical protein ACAW63_18230 [Pseudomonas sp. QE6]|uniref:hypothetical protein n=1 Tax=Pseudomonas sp. QE6 TaxID=3242491 RepID=UPI003529BCE9